MKFPAPLPIKPIKISKASEETWIVHLIGQSVHNHAYSGLIHIFIILNKASLQGERFSCLDMSWVESRVSLITLFYLFVSPAAKFKACPKQWTKGARVLQQIFLCANTIFGSTHVAWSPIALSLAVWEANVHS